MFIVAARKLIRNKWLSLCLVVGLLAAVALVTSIPMYSEGALQRVLRKDLIDYRDRTGYYPGGFTVRTLMSSTEDSIGNLLGLPDYTAAIEKSLLESLPLPVIIKTFRVNLKSLFALTSLEEDDKYIQKVTRLSAIPGFEDHIKLISGRLPASQSSGNVYEVIVHEQAMKEMDFLVGHTYHLVDIQLNVVGSVRISGAFRIDEQSREFWHSNREDFDSTFFIPYLSYQRVMESLKSMWAVDVEWFFGFDVSDIKTTDCLIIKRNIEKQLNYIRGVGGSGQTPLTGIIEIYLEKQRQLNSLLTFLITPVFIIVAFFIYMLAELIIDSEANEIALLKSRGSGTGQVLALYAIMFLIPCAAAFFAGPFFGWVISRLLGLAHGFLQFGKGVGIASRISIRTWGYAATALVLCFSTVLVPAFRASRTTIVLHKARKAGRAKQRFLKGFAPGMALLAVSLYALYSFGVRRQILEITGAQGSELPLDPIYFLAAIFFIFGAGLIVLKFLPVITSLIFLALRRVLPLVPYTSFLKISRSFGRERYAFFFLLLTVASGIFYSSAARTMNLGTEHQIYYRNGADVRFIPFSWYRWKDEDLLKVAAVRRELFDKFPELEHVEPETTSTISRRQFRPIEDYLNLDGVIDATRVAKIENATLIAPTGRRSRIQVFAIDPLSYGRAAWHRADLNEYALESYLRTMVLNPNHVFIAGELLERYHYDRDKPFRITFQEGGSMEVYAVDSIEYWPTVNPFEVAQEEKYMVICSLPYLEAMTALQNIEVWISRDPKVQPAEFYADMVKNRIDMLELSDSTMEVREETNTPSFAGINGALSLSFLVTISISLTGFVVCWIITLNERTLQFALFRSLGMSNGGVVGVLIWEQLLISGTALLSGSLIGSAVSRLFLPILNLNLGASDQVPPLQIGAYTTDYYTLIVFVILMLIFAFAFLGVFVSRMKVHQALKLGEE
ncbi:MAG: hypothetical protein CMN78_00940 [Spirochaetales bacterium]|nr:hypothetical protein [Spirochaetales bacterium]